MKIDYFSPFLALITDGMDRVRILQYRKIIMWLMQ